MQTILGLRADAPHHRLYVNPTLPDWFPEVELQQLRVGPCLIDLHFWREDHGSYWEVRALQAHPNTPQHAIIQVMNDSEEHSLV